MTHAKQYVQAALYFQLFNSIFWEGETTVLNWIWFGRQEGFYLLTMPLATGSLHMRWGDEQAADNTNCTPTVNAHQWLINVT